MATPSWDTEKVATVALFFIIINADTAKKQKGKCMARLRSLFEKELSSTPVNTLL